MAKVTFELELTGKTLTDVKEVALKRISSFLESDEDALENLVDTEYKVQLGEGTYKVTCYATVKRSISRIQICNSRLLTLTIFNCRGTIVL